VLGEEVGWLIDFGGRGEGRGWREGEGRGKGRGGGCDGLARRSGMMVHGGRGLGLWGIGGYGVWLLASPLLCRLSVWWNFRINDAMEGWISREGTVRLLT